MKRLLLATLIGFAACAHQAQAADVGVSVSIGQPGFYGQLDIGGFPPPAVVYSQPVIIEGGPVVRPPLYLRVPEEHMRHWDRYCREYRACGERVYFVRDDWYHREYVPRYQERYSHPQEHEREAYRHEERRDEHYDRRDEYRHEEHEHEHDHERGYER